MSYLAFDFTMEILLVRAKFMLEESALPPALRPLDAEIAFDDILPGGISIGEEKSNQPGKPAWQVTVTISCRRPPRFFTEFEDSASLTNPRTENRRRATAMDFALTNLVSGYVFTR
jgi:RNA-dependent RNA polymerase